MQSDKAYANKDVMFDRLSVALNYYFKGFSSWISLGLDNVKYKDGAEDYVKNEHKEDSITDYNNAKNGVEVLTTSLYISSFFGR